MLDDSRKPRYLAPALLALAWIVFQSAVDGYIHGNSLGQMVANHLPLGGFFFLSLLTLAVNPILGRISPKLRLTASELALVWMMIAAASAVPGYGMMEFLFPYLAAPLYFASPENQWAETIIPRLPTWAFLSDRSAVRDFYSGFGGPGPIPWRSWIAPAGFWIAFSLAFFALLTFWGAILRRQWVERERYVFPLVQVPVQLTQSTARNGKYLLSIGIGIAFLAHLLNGLHIYFPVIPRLRLSYSLAPLFPDKPWNALVQSWPLIVLIYFSVIGVTYFLQLDVALSLWFFFVFYKFEQVFFKAFSIAGVSTQHQVIGADFVLIGFLIWMARKQIARAVRTAINRDVADDSDEPLPYRLAVFGILLSSVVIILMSIAVGASTWVAVVYLILIWIMATIVAWMVANAGMLLVNIGFTPFGFLTTVLGSRRVGPNNLVFLSFDRSSIPHWSSESLMPYMLQGFRMADYTNLRKRLIVPLMAVGIIVAVVVAFIASLQFIYRQGAENLEGWIYRGVGRWQIEAANYAIQYPYGANLRGIQGMILGAAMMGFLIFMRYRFLWWPLHPIGYAVGVTYAPFHLWFSVMTGWFIKFLILKLGGLRAYRKYRPFFLGLIVGEYFMAAFWSFVGMKTGVGYWGLPH